MILANQTQTKEVLSEDFDAEEMMLLEACVSRIKKHLEKNLESAQNADQVSRLLDAQWYISQNF